jgi:hypothetical protein
MEQREYWVEVEAMAKNCAVEAKQDGRELSEVVWEACDGHEWVIYTRFHFDVLKHTGQDVADRFEDMGGPDLSKGWDHVVMSAAFLALEGDVSEKAQELFYALEAEGAEE